MSLPVNLIRYAGDWDVTRQYKPYDCVLSASQPSLAFVCISPVLGGPDPSIQPSAVWVPWTTATSSSGSEYASYISTATQPIATGVVTPVTYTGFTIQSAGLSLASPSQIQIGKTGVYRLLYSLQANKSPGGGTNAEVDVFISVNGTPVPDSASRWELSNNIENVLNCDYILALTAGQTIEVVAFTAGTGVTLPYFAPAGGVPATPSIITNISRIS